ncbi:hypothetical protein ACOME3_005737 [Neoechinorhynchus agilis]
MFYSEKCSKCSYDHIKRSRSRGWNRAASIEAFNRGTIPTKNASYTSGNRKFRDPQFQPNDSSLYGDSMHTKYSILQSFHGSNSKYNWHVERWLPPEMINFSESDYRWPLSVFNSPVPNDIVQGKLGDCWLIAALSLVAEVPSILYKILITKEYNPKGIYHVRLCDRGMWKVITVDDRLPVNKYDSFIFTFAKRRQLFASLIEKAFAKLHGNYNALKSGRCDEGLQALTGEPTEVIFLRQTSHGTENGTKHSGRLDREAIWNRILAAKRAGYLMTCPASNSKLTDGFFDKYGIESNHAYSIIDVQINPLDIRDGHRIVVLRNPWGGTSAHSLNHGTHSAIVPQDSNGLITLNYQDMPTFFSSISLCKFNPTWTEVRKRGQFGSFASMTIDSVYVLEIKQVTQIDIELFNAGDGYYYNRRHDPDVDLCLIVQKENKIICYNHDVDFYVCATTMTLSPGRYIVYALSFATFHLGVYPIYNIVFHASHQFVVHDHSISSKLLGWLFQQVALRYNNFHMLSRQARILTFNDNGNFGMVIENRYSQAIKIHSDFRGTKNVNTSRLGNFCVDVVPPMSRMLIAIFVRRIYRGNVLISYKSKAQKTNQLESHQPKLSTENYYLHRAIPISV